jgi:hypothetical protein
VHFLRRRLDEYSQVWRDFLRQVWEGSDIEVRGVRASVLSEFYLRFVVMRLVIND